MRLQVVRAAPIEHAVLPAALRDSPLGSWVDGPELWAGLCRMADLDVKAPVTRLASGKMGTAYQVGSDQVVKITTDRDEAIASAHIMQRPDPTGNVVKIKLVARFQTHPIFAIVEELLGPADPVWVEMSNMWGRWAKFQVGEYRAVVKNPDNRGKPPPPKLYRMSVPTVRLFAGQVFGVDAEDPNDKEFFDSLPAAVKRDAHEFLTWLLAVAAYLDRIRVEFSDLHGNNILRRGQQHVLIDLGKSTSPAIAIPALAAMLDRLARVLARREPR